MSTLKDQLAEKIAADIECLMPAQSVKSGTQILARRRLQRVADKSPLMLIWLAEPWQNDNDNVNDFLFHCARIHLYARILDDAIDENLPVHRLNLLRYQPQFWAALGALAGDYSERWSHCSELITETVVAVEEETDGAAPATWGKKNHHLLLIPLLLAKNDADFLIHKEALSDFIWLMQAGEEWQQGVLNNAEIIHEVLLKIEAILASEEISKLMLAGWTRVAERMLWDCKNLLLVLSR
ncbi:MAG: hypothetical protein Q9O24_06790 [Gammaproteobacteria bacterium]|nr:hypothetical protein [Gammaproteobacteria bacterium]